MSGSSLWPQGEGGECIGWTTLDPLSRSIWTTNRSWLSRPSPTSSPPICSPRPSDGTKDHTIFLFTPVDDAGGAVVRAGSILRVQHYRSGQILHTNLQGPPDRTTETTTTLTLASKVRTC